MGTGRGAALQSPSAALGAGGWGRPKGGRWSGRAGGDGMGPGLRLVTGGGCRRGPWEGGAGARREATPAAAPG